jgi:dienelactone hydrolase
VGRPSPLWSASIRRSLRGIIRRVNPASRLRTELAQLVAFEQREGVFDVSSERRLDGYRELRVRYAGIEEEIPALLLVPDGAGPFPAVLAHHQHNSEWHLGKSEVAGLAGEPLQAFGPALARAGLVVLAPDAVGFEDRRYTGTIDEREDDWLQYFNEMAYRLVSGRLLVTTVLGDAACGLSALLTDERVDGAKLGAVGHSYGGYVTILLAALDERVGFACASGSVCSYKRRMLDRTGIEFSQAIPGILELADIDRLLGLIAPRPVLLLSATEDRYSADAPEVVQATIGAWEAHGAQEKLKHVRYKGGHALTKDRFDAITNWVIAQTTQEHEHPEGQP